MIKMLDMPENFKQMEIELGSGDLMVGLCRRQGEDQERGIAIYENPDGVTPVGTKNPSIAGEAITCIAEYGVSIFFKSTTDIDRLIKDLNKLKDIMSR